MITEMLGFVKKNLMGFELTDQTLSLLDSPNRYQLLRLFYALKLVAKLAEYLLIYWIFHKFVI